MYVGGVNFTSLLFMNVYRIYIFIAWFVFAPLLMNWQKRGEGFWEFIYACLFSCLWIYVLFNAKRGKEFDEFYACLYIYVCLVLCTSLNIFMFIVMHELRGASMKLNFNPCIYNSMSFVIIKKGRLLVQRPIALVLMMINSCSYSTNDLVLI